MRVLSVCSGIGAETVAWAPLGFKTVGFCEIESHASAVLNHHYPSIVNHGDFTKLGDNDYERETVDVLVGGTPCQDFSAAGNRSGLGGKNGNLAIEFFALVDRLRPRWVCWENVPGVLSHDAGRTFGAVIGALVEFGYGVCWRVLDAQYVRVQSHPFAVAQRRRRVFVVGYFGDWRPPAAVCLEPKGLLRCSPPHREKRVQTIARSKENVEAGDFWFPSREVSNACCSHSNRQDAEMQPFVIHKRKENSYVGFKNGVRSISINDSGVSPTLETKQSGAISIYNKIKPDYLRRLTPVETERLQGLPDNYTQVPYRKKPMCDGPRYKMIGNSIAINCLSWLGQRIMLADRAIKEVNKA